MARTTDTFGTITKRTAANGATSYRVRYVAPDGTRPSRTFHTKGDAQAWLTDERRRIDRDEWKPLTVRKAQARVQAVSVAEYAERYVTRREAGATAKGKPLAPKTSVEYRRYLARFVAGDPLGALPLGAVTVADAQEWRVRVVTQAAAQSGDDRHTGATQAARVYGFMKAVYNDAVDAELVARSPFREKGAAHVERAKKITGATDAEILRLAQAMPDRLTAAVYVAAYTGIRRSELRGLRRRDVDVDGLRLHIRRQAQDVGGRTVTRDATKTVASTASAALPEPVARLLAAHMDKFTGPGPDAYVFAGATGKPVADSVLRRAWDRARDAVGRRDDLDWHDLRHTGAMKVYRAQGLRAAQRFLRHATPQATLTYLSVTDDDLDNAVSLLGASVILPTATGKDGRHLRVA